jgi:hypothetical protein
VKAELIEGEVHIHSPQLMGGRAHARARAIWWITHYRAFTLGTDSAANATVRLDPNNEMQPVGSLYVLPEYGGQVRLSHDGFMEGAPELVVETTSSTESIDLGRKMTAYQRNGVREYVVWRVFDDAIDWFALRDLCYEPLAADAAGIVRSEVFPGLWLNRPAMESHNLLAVQSSLQHGLESPEHALFVVRLEDRQLVQCDTPIFR